MSPEDVARALAAQAPDPPPREAMLGEPRRPPLAIVVPVLDEAAGLPALARHLRAVCPDADVLVVDGGSADRSVDVARAAGLRVIEADRGRGAQLNAGAAATRAPHLCFLHADTRLPVGAPAYIAEALADDRIALGAFSLRIDDRGLALRIIERGARLRARAGLPLGDQAFFLRRERLEQLGGFARWPMLEDMDLARRAAGLGRVTVLRPWVVTSARRWRRDGVLKTTARNWAITAAFLSGWRPAPIP